MLLANVITTTYNRHMKTAIDRPITTTLFNAVILVDRLLFNLLTARYIGMTRIASWGGLRSDT